MGADQHRETAGEHHIREDADSQRQYVLHPEDNDLFIRTGRQVIEACRLGISIEVWFHECEGMFHHVADWVKDERRGGRVLACYGVARGSGIAIFVVPRGESFDFDLADELAVLNADLVRNFRVGPVEIHQLPADELGRFLQADASVRIYGHAA